MVCTHARTAGGSMWLCSRGQRGKRCKVCGRDADLLCDYPLKGKKSGQTCDAPLCRVHAVRQGASADGKDSVDFCQVHHEMRQKETLELFG